MNPPNGTQDDATPGRAREALKRHFGHEAFRPGQENVVLSAVAGRNLLVVMPTGSGKSLLYQLPALLADGLTLVISPLIALMKDQVDELARRGVPATFINSSLGLDEQQRRMNDCMSGAVRLLYVAPERFQSAPFLAMLRQVKIARMAVDEAHCISEWGHDFRPDYRRLRSFREQMGRPRVTALTATATPRVQQDIIESLGLAPNEVEVHVRGFDRPNLALSVVYEPGDEKKIHLLREMVRRETGSGIIYVGTRKKTDEIAMALREIEPTVIPYHAGLDPEARSQAQERFLSGRARVAVATIAFGMGIDKRDVRFVAHYNYPGSVEQYYQEIGRAGRDGLPSRCVLLHSPEDRYLRQFFIDLNYPSPETVAAVYDALWALPENPVMKTYQAIAQMCGDIKDGHVGAAVRMLDGAGLTRALAGNAEAAVTLERPGAEILAKIRQPLRKRVFEALSADVDLESPGHYKFSLGEIAHAAGLTEEQVRRALAALDEEGHIAYDPPFRGRGIEKLVSDPPPFEKVPIDWARQNALRRIEESKLEKMEEYMRQRDCRRAFILRYFGEETSLRCGMCDTCEESAPRPEGERKASVLTQQPLIASAALAAVRHIPFAVGTGFIAEILTGSRAERVLRGRHDLNPAYGTVPAKRELIKRVVEDLAREGYLCVEGARGRPVLTLTPRGCAAAEEAEEALAARPATETADFDGAEGDIEQAILGCVAGLKPAVGIGKIAEVLTGSKAAWIARTGADAMPFYGSITTKRELVREKIEEMLHRRLLARSGDSQYPVLALTSAGEAVLQRQVVTSAAPPPPKPPTMPMPQPRPQPVQQTKSQAIPAGTPAEPPDAKRLEPRPVAPAPKASTGVLDALLNEMLVADRERALALLEELKLFHPREIVARLAARLESAQDETLARRLVWVLGEVGESHGLPHLLKCAASPFPSVRRLTASALRKLIESGCIPPSSAPVREALERLRQDPAPQVRQYAEKALAQIQSRA